VPCETAAAEIRKESVRTLYGDACATRTPDTVTVAAPAMAATGVHPPGGGDERSGAAATRPP